MEDTLGEKPHSEDGDLKGDEDGAAYLERCRQLLAEREDRLDAAATLVRSIQAKLAELGGGRVIAGADVVAMLSKEKLRQTLDKQLEDAKRKYSEVESEVQEAKNRLEELKEEG